MKGKIDMRELGWQERREKDVSRDGAVSVLYSEMYAFIQEIMCY